MSQEDKDLAEISNIDAIMKKLHSGVELTEEEQQYLKNPKGTKLEAVPSVEPEEKKAVKEAIPITGLMTAKLGITLSEYMQNKRVSSALRNQINTRSFMIQAAQLFAMTELLDDVKQLLNEVRKLTTGQVDLPVAVPQEEELQELESIIDPPEDEDIEEEAEQEEEEEEPEEEVYEEEEDKKPARKKLKRAR